jgi:probable lipoprotein NlpC
MQGNEPGIIRETFDAGDPDSVLSIQRGCESRSPGHFFIADVCHKCHQSLIFEHGFFKLRAMQLFRLQSSSALIFPVMIVATLLASCSSSKRATAVNDHIANPQHKSKIPEKNVVVIDSETLETEGMEEKSRKKRKADAPEEKAEKVVSTARTFIGTPYKYGGTTRSGMDCSALLINSFSAVKLNLPRSSEAQSKVGTEIKMHELKPGDLVFFATGNKKKQITHVGLVTDVKAKDNVKFIHASSSLGVVETNLFAEYYQKRFRGARRVIE